MFGLFKTKCFEDDWGFTTSDYADAYWNTNVPINPKTESNRTYLRKTLELTKEEIEYLIKERRGQLTVLAEREEEAKRKLKADLKKQMRKHLDAVEKS